MKYQPTTKPLIWGLGTIAIFFLLILIEYYNTIVN